MILSMDFPSRKETKNHTCEYSYGIHQSMRLPNRHSGNSAVSLIVNMSTKNGLKRVTLILTELNSNALINCNNVLPWILKDNSEINSACKIWSNKVRRDHFKTRRQISNKTKSAKAAKIATNLKFRISQPQTYSNPKNNNRITKETTPNWCKWRIWENRPEARINCTWMTTRNSPVIMRIANRIHARNKGQNEITKLQVYV